MHMLTHAHAHAIAIPLLFLHSCVPLIFDSYNIIDSYNSRILHSSDF